MQYARKRSEKILYKLSKNAKIKQKNILKRRVNLSKDLLIQQKMMIHKYQTIMTKVIKAMPLNLIQFRFITALIRYTATNLIFINFVINPIKENGFISFSKFVIAIAINIFLQNACIAFGLMGSILLQLCFFLLHFLTHWFLWIRTSNIWQTTSLFWIEFKHNTDVTSLLCAIFVISQGLLKIFYQLCRGQGSIPIGQIPYYPMLLKLGLGTFFCTYIFYTSKSHHLTKPCQIILLMIFGFFSYDYWGRNMLIVIVDTIKVIF